MIKAVFFDFDGVLTTEFNGTESVCGNLCNAIPELSFDAVVACYKKHFRHLLSASGKHADTWEDFCACLGHEMSMQVFLNALQTVSINEEMIRVARILKARHVVGIITDNSVERMEHVGNVMKLSALFDPIIVSASVRATKHEGTTRIFDAALQAAKCKPEESLFIDNQGKNLRIPKEMGMNTYWHDDEKNDMQSCITFLRTLKVEI